MTTIDDRRGVSNATVGVILRSRLHRDRARVRGPHPRRRDRLVLRPTATEEVTVTAEAPSVDLKSTEVNFNYTADAIRQLPLPRSYKGLFQLVPGVADSGLPESSSLGPAAGGSRQDNTYLIDG